MIDNSDQITKKIKFNWVGVDGNAFFILGTFSKQARKEGWSKEEIDAVIKEASSGDYDHLLRTVIRHTI